jgi:DNA-binding CsgD family transcriptional regulator
MAGYFSEREILFPISRTCLLLIGLGSATKGDCPSRGFYMKEIELQDHLLIEAASHALDVILSSTDPDDLCRQIVHSDYVPNSIRRCEIFYLDGKSILRSVGSYGLNTGQSEEISAWGDSPLSEAIRTKKLVAGKVEHLGSEFEIIAIPFIAHSVPVGLMTIVVEGKKFELRYLQVASEMFSKLGAFYLESLDLGNKPQNGSGPSPANSDHLSTRQITILSHIQDGLVNMEIAKELLLSESTIRQETVRIYRVLGVGNRQDAVKRGQVLGILSNNPHATGL